MRRTSLMIVVAALGMAACASPGTGLTDDPPDPDAVVLRVDIAGGFVPVDVSLAHFPTWTLYADGRLITEGAQIEIYPPPALPSVVVRDLTPAAIDEIVRRAREAGLEGEDRRYDTMMISDAPTTTFTIVVDGDRHVTEVYALAESDLQAGDDGERAAREKLAAFWADLGDLGSWIDAGELGEERMFEPGSMRVYVRPYDKRTAPDDLDQPVKDWPLDEPLASFGEEAQVARCGVVEGADFDAVYAAAGETNTLTPWRSDGERFFLTFSPLLPDQNGC